ncbi:condensin-2 complex subunit H2 isoform 1-T2 [Spinachia spinachia]
MDFSRSRFPHLMQPIRELTKNWEVDVASELNDYLEELDNMTITLDGGETRLNFAEAALLIQGSAHIYSKKVEHLHSLVYQTLEFLNDRNRKNKPTSSQEKDEAARGSDDEFNLIDIVVSRRLMRSESTMSVSIAPLLPECLILPELSERLKLPLISVTGDILCSQKNFMMNRFVPGDQGLILLPLGSRASRVLQDGDQNHVDCVQNIGEVEDEGRGALVGDEGGDDHFFNIDLDQEHEEHEEHEELEEHVERHQVEREGRPLRRVEDRAPRAEKPTLDPWLLHDAYAMLGGEASLKAAKCFSIPDGLDHEGKRKRRPAYPLQDFWSWSERAFEPLTQKLKNGPSCPALNYIYVTTMADRLRAQRMINKRAGVVVSDDELVRTFLELEEGPQQQAEEPVDCGYDEHNEQETFPDDIPVEPDLISAGTRRDDLSYEELVLLRMEQLMENSKGWSQDTALSRKVQEWEDKIRPLLVEQEQRPVFDIHDYGDRIVSALRDVGQRRSFSSIVFGLENHETSKYLVASLQLANDGTVEVDSAAGLEDSLDSMRLTLVSTEKARDRLKDMATVP